tara:strand:+ start:678 stop:1133 length:456 start_codon:yes stop_codon:yes gene_type:complete
MTIKKTGKRTKDKRISDFTSHPFVCHVISKCKKFNVNFLISPDKEISKDGTLCDGYFEHPEKGDAGVLVICLDKPQDEVLHTLAHEFSHLMQWYEDDPLYLAWNKKDNEANTHALEIDVEHRAIKMLDEWNLLTEEAKERSAKYLREMTGE